MRTAIGVGGRVAVIGAGAGGLCSARNLKTFGTNFNVVVFEQQAEVGGTWKYSDKVGVHSSLYKSLKTNLPKQIMNFPTVPFAEELPSFPGHEDVQKYLVDYATNEDLRPNIRFETKVVKVSRDLTDKSWLVRSQGAGSTEVVDEKFDALLVCNGHYSVPIVPPIPGLETFAGTTLHSHDYREPSRFQNRRVLLLGDGNSGRDISLEIATVAEFVVLSHRAHKGDEGVLPNLTLRPVVERIEGSWVTFEDGRSIEADDIMFCTGYEYDFPFIDPEVGLVVRNTVVRDLYRHLVFIPKPTLYFLGLPKRVVPLPMMHYQSLYITALLAGEIELPPTEEMYADLEREWRDMGDKPERYFHVIAGRQWEYNRQLAEEAGHSPLPQVIEDIYDDCAKFRKSEPLEYRKREYHVVDDENSLFTVQVDGHEIEIRAP